MRLGGLIAAIVLAAIAAVVVLRMSAQEQAPAPAPMAQPQQQQIATTTVFVASRPIPIGTVITADMLSQQPWPSHLVLDGFITTESERKIEGMVARGAFQQDEPFLLNKLSNPDDPSFLAGSLPKGMRVLTVQTNEVEGVAGFIFPGDFVDVILTHNVKSLTVSPTDGQPREENTSVSETLLTNVKVLAVDQSAAGGSRDPNGKLLVPRSISLMVTPTDAQRLRLAQQSGTLTLALRSIEDRESADQLTITNQSDISQFNQAGTATAPRTGVVIVRGITVGEDKSNRMPYFSAPSSIPTPRVTP